MKTATFEITENNTLSFDNPEVNVKITLKDIKKVISITDEIEDNELVYKEFKFSEDGTTFSYWAELTNERLTRLNLQSSSVLKIRYNFNPPTDDAVVIVVDKIIIKYEETDDSEIIYVKQKESSSLKVNTPKFNIYQGSDIATDLQQKLSKSVNEFIGLHAIYYKSDVIATDTFLHEHTLLELADKCGVEIKVIFEDNEMPDKPMVTPFGTTFEVPVKIHLDYTYFKEHFKDHVPSAGDIVFIPITKGIWEVNGSDLVRGVMNNPLYWDVTLSKYSPRASRSEDRLKHESILDNLRAEGFSVMTAEESFRDDWDKDEEKVIKPRETRPKGVNEKISKDKHGTVDTNKKVKIVKEEIENNFIIVSHYNYNVGEVLSSEAALTYNKSHVTTGDLSFSAWLKIRNLSTLSKVLIKIENNTIYSSKFSNQGTNDYTLESKDGSTIKDVTVEDNTIQTDVSNGLYYITEKHISNLYNNWNIINNRYIENKDYDIVIDSNNALTTNSWYNILITESVRYNQVRVYIYKQQPNREELLLVYDSKPQEITGVSEISFDKVVIKGGLSRITNIRLFDEMLQPKDHHIVLNQQLVNDSHKAIIVDNAKPVLLREEYGRPL